MTREAPTGRGATARNVGLVAGREYSERVKSRAFVFSTLLMVGLAVVIALIPLAFRLMERATVTRIAVAAPDAALADRTVSILDAFLNTSADGTSGGPKQFVFEVPSTTQEAVDAVANAQVAGAVLVERTGGGLDFQVVTIGGLGQDKLSLLQLGAFSVGVLDWTASNPNNPNPFVPPGFAVVDAGAAGAGGGAAVDTSEYASRRIVGIVFVVLLFLTLVFYGLWVASGVVAEKASRVMELLISAATAPQLVMGKILGIGLAGLTQVTMVLVPALAMMVLSGQVGNAMLGEDPGAATSLAGLSPGLLLAFLVYFVLGFALYAALYAGAGSLLSRAEDLQIIALPLSIPAILGYLPAVLALSGSSAGFIRLASYVPLWSPFVMMARLSIGRVEPWELALSLGLLVATVPVVTWLAIRVYRAGVLMYGQPPTVKTFLRAVKGS
ncbi:MAG TPA: ABC transporter permease [Candidatus Limnocylindrales bacterium]|nr:ABC transporter permease [Candidatus Limnocylindrales bacterium]